MRHTTGNTWTIVLGLCLAGAGLLAACTEQPTVEPTAEPGAGQAAPIPVAEEAQTPEEPGPMTFSRALSQDTWTPGDTLDVIVSLAYNDPDPVTAIAVVEELPEGWSFVETLTEPLPAIVPEAGQTGELTFVWISVPEWPFNLSYRVQAPDVEKGPAGFSGQALYRTSGDELRTPLVSTVAVTP